MLNISRGYAPEGTAAVVVAATLPAGVQEGGHCYALQTATERLVVDPSQKGEPGDLVVVWPKKRGPVLTRRLARRSPFNTYHFCDLGTGDVFELPCNKVSAIHAVAGHLAGRAS